MIRILALSALLLLLATTPKLSVAAYQDAGSETLTLRVSFEKSFRSWMLENVTLDAAHCKSETRPWVDSSTKKYTLEWTGLKAGKHQLRIETFFGEARNLDIHASKDTTITIRSWYTVLDSISAGRFLRAGPIRVYHFSYGCFGGHVELLTIDTLPRQRRLNCTVTDFMSGDLDSIGRRWPVTVPIRRIARVEHTIVSDLEKVLINCMRQELTRVEDMKCRSTAGQALIVRAGDGIYAFRDYGICQWDDYRPFIERYNPGPKSPRARQRKYRSLQRKLRERRAGIIAARP